MDPVGDVADGNLVLRDARPQTPPHLAGHLAVQLADAVPEGRHAEGQHRHAEWLGLVRGVDPAQAQKVGAAEPEPGYVAREIAVHQIRGESIVTGDHRGVAREHRSARGQLTGLVERELLGFHQTARMLERQKRRMPLVHVVDAGLDSHGFQRAIAADAEQDLLLESRLAVAAVELVGDIPILGARILRDVGVQQVERHSADIDAPDARHHVAPRKLHRNRPRRAVGHEFTGTSGRLWKSLS